jgi:hypothetical protein
MPDSRSRQGHQRVHEQWAHLRFAVVGWLLAAPPEKGELRAAITDLAQRTWQHPTTGEPVRFGFSTIERWYYRAVAELDFGRFRRREREHFPCAARYGTEFLYCLGLAGT